MPHLHRRLVLLTLAFLESMLVAVQTVWIVQQWYVGVFVNSVLICVVWLSNIRKMTTDASRDDFRVAYVLGASLGTTAGIWVANALLSWLH